jgi:hypothetical protein
MQSTTFALNPKYQAINSHSSQGGINSFLGRFLHKDEFFWSENLNDSNQPPRAAAGFDAVVMEGAAPQLNGTASFDPEGVPLTYTWTQTAGPSVSLSDATTATPSFTAPTVGTTTVLGFQLVVNDGALSSAPDLVHVTVQAAQTGSNIAALAVVTASSQNTANNQQAIKAVDGVVDGYPGDYTREWATLSQTVGAWLQLTWGGAYTIDQVVLHDRPNINDQITSATLSFSDGSSVTVGTLPNDSELPRPHRHQPHAHGHRGEWHDRQCRARGDRGLRHVGGRQSVAHRQRRAESDGQ